jgi:hypothetical protein
MSDRRSQMEQPRVQDHEFHTGVGECHEAASRVTAELSAGDQEEVRRQSPATVAGGSQEQCWPSAEKGWRRQVERTASVHRSRT